MRPLRYHEVHIIVYRECITVAMVTDKLHVTVAMVTDKLHVTVAMVTDKLHAVTRQRDSSDNGGGGGVQRQI